MKRRSRGRGSSAVRVLFGDIVISDDKTERTSTIDQSPSPTKTKMTSPFYHQTLDSQTQEGETQDVDNYVEGLDGDYHTRLRFWVDKTPGVTTYAVQLTAIFEAGACINTNKLEKEAGKLKEMALKYEAVVKKIGRDGILLPSEVRGVVEIHVQKSQKFPHGIFVSNPPWRRQNI